MRRTLLRMAVGAGVLAFTSIDVFAQTAQAPVEMNDNFFSRLFQAYADEFSPAPVQAAQDSATPTRRPAPFPPAPETAPPFPFADWPFGGTPLIGGATPNSSGGNLMKALHGTSFGDVLNNNNIEIWGWFEPGMNVSTSHGKFGNLPAAYDYTPDRPMLNQAVVYIERIPDTVQQDHIDWGFRVIGVYGTDWRFLDMEGVFARQELKADLQYGYDIPNFYTDLYIPWIGEGTDVRFGRYVSLPDIEADLSLQNYFYSHALYYTYDPFTQFGIVSSTRLNNNWMVQVGISAGNDTAPWASSAQPSPLACVQWNSDSSWDNVYLCDNGTNNGKYGFNNLQMYAFTWFHKITERLHIATEEYYLYENKVPTVSTILGANPALCHTGTRCWSGDYAAAFYIMYQISDKDFIGIRNELYDDVRGQRTGFATLYTENTLGGSHWFSNSIAVRPEIRFDHSYNATAYDNGRARSQFTAAADMIIKY